MSTMKKRIPMFLLALAMMVAMAAPTFADGFHPAGCGNLYLNITRSSTSQSVYQRPLCLYETDYKPDTAHNDQNFTIGTSSEASGFSCMSHDIPVTLSTVLLQMRALLFGISDLVLMTLAW